MKTKLPEGWKEVELGNQEYFTILSSGIDKFEGDKEYLSTESIQGTKISKIEATITYKDRHSRANMQPVLNSVWFAKMQATLKVYSFDEENREEIKKYILSTGFAGIKVNEKLVSPKYLRLMLISKDFNGLKDKLSTGSTQRGINNQAIETISLIIPPLLTQQKIVSILEKAEQAEKWRKEADKLTKEFLKSVFVGMFKGISTIKELKELTTEFKFGTSVKSGSEGYPVLGIPNVLGEKIILHKCNNVKLTEKEFNNFSLQMNDILFVRTNGNPNYVGRCGIFHLNNSNYVFASYLIRARINLDLLNPFFLKAYLNLPMGRKELLSKCRTTAGQYNINTQGLGSIRIPLPPIELQQKFASIVKEVEAMKEQQKQSKINLDNLFSALMQKAFKGELVA